MKFIYLIQTEGRTPYNFWEVEERSKHSEDIGFLKLTYREEFENAIYFPNSTWTEGRNRLIKEAQKLNESYDYYILCDDDLEIQHGSWREFEWSLIKHQPALATPYYKSRRPKIDHLDAHTIYDIDAMANAIHRDLIEDAIIFPYFGAFDTESWWISQFFVIHIAAIIYGDHIMCSNALGISNAKSREYPRLVSTPEEWLKYEDWMFEHVFEDKKFARSRFHHHYLAKHMPCRPMPSPRKTYRLSVEERGLIKSSGPFRSGILDRQSRKIS